MTIVNVPTAYFINNWLLFNIGEILSKYLVHYGTSPPPLCKRHIVFFPMLIANQIRMYKKFEMALTDREAER